MEFVFESRGLAGEAKSFVESLWFAQGRMTHRRERIAPTGSTVAVLVLGPPIVQTPRNGEGVSFTANRGWLAGPHDHPVINAPTGETLAVGVVSTPVGCRALFGLDPAPIRGSVVDLLSSWAPARALHRRLVGVTDPATCLDAVAGALLARLQEPLPGWRRCAAAVAALEADPRRKVADIAGSLGISHAHLDREFVRIVGMTPRGLARILRFRRLLAQIDIEQEVSWADLASEWGWFDQSHFIRDFKRHTGVTPSGYLAAQRSALAVGQYEPGFVPELM